MTAEQQIRLQIGDMVITIAILNEQKQKLEDRIRELEAQLTPKK